MILSVMVLNIRYTDGRVLMELQDSPVVAFVSRPEDESGMHSAVILENNDWSRP